MLSRADKIFIALIGLGLLSIYVGVVSMYLWLGLMLVRLFFLNRVELGIFSLLFGSSLFGRLFVSDMLVVVLTTIFLILGYVLLFKEMLAVLVRYKMVYIVFALLVLYFVVMYLLGPMNPYATGKIARLVVRAITWMFMFQIYVQNKNINNVHFAILYALLSIFYLSQAFELYGVRPSGLFDITYFRDGAEVIGRNEKNTLIVNPHTMGYLALGPLTFYLARDKIELKSIWNLLFVTILVLLVFTSGARQTMVCMAGIFALRVMQVKGNIAKNALLAILCVGMLAIIALNSGSSAIERSLTGNNACEVLHRDIDTPFEVIKINPVFGVGFGGYIDFGNKEYPHNIFLEIIAELGLIGCIILSTFLVLSLSVSCIGFKYKTANGTFFFLFLVVYFFKSMISGDLSGNIVVFILILSFIDYSKFK